MPSFKLSRRTVLRGAGSIAVALPWLEAMGEGRARAQTASVPLKRFISVYQPGGTVREGAIGDKYTPTGSETSFTMSPILAPLDPVKSKLIIVDGVNLTSGDQFMFTNVEQHQGGSVGWLTGAVQPGFLNYPTSSPSIDQLLVSKLSVGKPYPSLQLAIRWATGKSKGKLSAMNAINFQAASPNAPIPPRLDPQDIFTTLFGSPMGGTGGGGAGGVDPNAIALMRKKSVLDYVDKKYASLKAKLGADDQARLDQHLTQVRDLESRIVITTTTPPPNTMMTACKQPTWVDTMGYNPSSGLNSATDGSIKDPNTDMKIPVVGQFMMDMIVMALACEKTGVASLQWSDTEAKHTFPWLNLSEHHHFYQHDGGFAPTQCAQIATWYSQMHLYLLQKMQQVDMGGHTLLDESVVFFGSEISHPPTHTKTNMPFILAGGDGKSLRTGRWIKCGGVPHNKLLTAILNLYGDTRTNLGDSRVDSKPLSSPSLT